MILRAGISDLISDRGTECIGPPNQVWSTRVFDRQTAKHNDTEGGTHAAASVPAPMPPGAERAITSPDTSLVAGHEGMLASGAPVRLIVSMPGVAGAGCPQEAGGRMTS